MDKLELIRLILSESFSSAVADKASDPFAGAIGQYCICRGTGAGVHAGTVAEISPPDPSGTRSVRLVNARRMWKWHAASGVSLSGCAVHGIRRDKSKIESTVPQHYIAGVCEIIPCTDAAKESIHGA